MPLPLEELVEFLVKNPKRIIVYVALVGAGWLSTRLLPDDCHLEVSRWQSLYYNTARSRDSLQRTKDNLYEQLLERNHQLKHTDSLIYKLGRKADTIFKHRHHVK